VAALKASAASRRQTISSGDRLSKSSKCRLVQWVGGALRSNVPVDTLLAAMGPGAKLR
jgi:hypothetical protein